MMTLSELEDVKKTLISDAFFYLMGETSRHTKYLVPTSNIKKIYLRLINENRVLSDESKEWLRTNHDL